MKFDKMFVKSQTILSLVDVLPLILDNWIFSYSISMFNYLHWISSFAFSDDTCSFLDDKVLNSDYHFCFYIINLDSFALIVCSRFLILSFFILTSLTKFSFCCSLIIKFLISIYKPYFSKFSLYIFSFISFYKLKIFWSFSFKCVSSYLILISKSERAGGFTFLSL